MLRNCCLVGRYWDLASAAAGSQSCWERWAVLRQWKFALRRLGWWLVAVGGSVGQFLALPYTHALIEGFGWVTALIILAATTLLIVPLAFGLVGKRSSEVEEGPQNLSSALLHACRTPSFWLLTLGFFVCGFHLAFVAVHLPAYLADKAFAPWLATAALTTIGVSNIVGVYCCGYLGDNFPKKNVLSVLYLARAGIFLLFLITPLSEFSVLVFAALIGFLWLGTVPLTSGLVGSVFGVTYLSMLFGIVFLGHQIGGFLGAWLGGVAFDALGSYASMWWISVGLGAFSAVVH
jgi:predicted MFS family arabinose efflux permease